ncbi:hypothetical protein D3C86_1390230 [compost metagenome]
MGNHRFLQHELKGLASGCILRSVKNGEFWTVINRIVHFPEIEKTFENEMASHTHLYFGTVENRIEAESKAIERQQNNIYQYQLEGTEKP